MSRLFFVRTTLPMLLGGICAALLTYAVVRQSAPRHKLTVVEHGVLYRSGPLTARELEDEIRRRGIRTVVSLDGGDAADAAVCRRLGVRRVNISMYEMLATTDGAQDEFAGCCEFDLTPLWNLLDDPQALPVLIKCADGVRRTGMAAATYRIRRQGWTAGDAIAEMEVYGFNPKDETAVDVLAWLRNLAPGDLAEERTLHVHVADDRKNATPEPVEAADVLRR